MKLFSAITAFVLGVFTIQAQQIETTTTNFDDNTFSANLVTIDVPFDQVKDYWDEFWDDNYDIDVDRENREHNSETYLAEQVRLAEVSDKAFDLWSKLMELNESRTSIALAVGFGYDISASPDNFPQSFDRAKEYLIEFRTYAYDKYFNMQIEEVQDQLSDIRDNREDAVDDQQKSNKRIEKWQDKIRKYEEKIADERSSLVEEGEMESQSEVRIAELERELSRLQSMRSRYVNGRRK